MNPDQDKESKLFKAEVESDDTAGRLFSSSFTNSFRQMKLSPRITTSTTFFATSNLLPIEAPTFYFIIAGGSSTLVLVIATTYSVLRHA